MTIELHDACVYTIATPERLLEAARDEMPLHESKRWVTANAMLQEAADEGRKLPIVFADSRHCTALIVWSVLRSIRVTSTGTDYTLDAPLWRVPRSRPQDLQILNSGINIAEGHRRPYVLCRTPSFLYKQASKPLPWLQSSTVKRETREGERRLVAHMRQERNRKVVITLKKEQMQRHNGRLPCKICNFDFIEAYGFIGAGFAEAHHITSLSEAPKAGRIVSIRDFALVCSNCHSMLHRGPDFPSIEALRHRFRTASK